jgi:Rieske Fe-S protein
MTEAPGGTSRRGFLTWFLGTSVGALLVAVVYPVWHFINPPRIPEAATSQVDAGGTRDPEFQETGFKIIQFGVEPVIVVKVSDDDFRAFAATCTHLDCIVEFQKDEQRIWCNCHNGHYDLTGRNVGGPPPRPLAAYQVNVESGADPRQPGRVIVSRA